MIRRTKHPQFFFLFGILLSFWSGEIAAAKRPIASTLPFTTDHNRMIVELEFIRTDGTVRKARVWVDSGGQYLTLCEPLARDLGLDISQLSVEKQMVELFTPNFSLQMNGLSLDLNSVPVRVQIGAYFRPGVPAEACLPASVLRHYQVVFDYPNRKITIAKPGSLKHVGVGIPCRVNSETGLFMIAIEMDGDTVQLGIDNGSAGTWLSDILTSKWQTRHPDWPVATGAAGSANFFGFPFETTGALMRLPDLVIGNLPLHDVGILSLDQSLFDWYSGKSAGPVLGFIGANVLKNYRLEIDFANQMTYWQADKTSASGDLDIVGLTLRPEADNSLTIAGVVHIDDQPAVAGIQSGDKLIRVDQTEVATSTMGSVINALRGKPGDPRTLIVERDGKIFQINAKVLHLP